MSKIFHPLLALVASATDNDLAKYVEYLKHENKILRARLPKQIHTTIDERQMLLKYGKVVGRAIEELISIVSPATFYRWVRDEKEAAGEHDDFREVLEILRRENSERWIEKHGASWIDDLHRLPDDA